ncbi:MAG TPA: hypothetical protein VN461_12140 [Vicinamibacteria bacterium]|nr:hypothetical protein [Vicinamibacteria bacterium]
MKGLRVIVIFLVALGGSGGSAGNANPQKPPAAPLEPSPEMARLLQAFTGDWSVSESFEISQSRRGATRQGVASLKAGPGFSLLEEYRSNGSAGELRFLGVFWWDPNSKVYRLLTCSNNDGCGLRGTGVWEGDRFVNTWEEELQAKSVAFKDSFIDISPTSFTLVSQGVAEGTPIWHVTTKYRRQTETPSAGHK